MVRPRVVLRIESGDNFLDDFTVVKKADVLEDGSFTPVTQLLIDAFATAIAHAVADERRRA